MQKSTEFGYSRKDVILIGASIFGGGFAMYYGLQAVGVSAGIAGNYVQLFVVLGLCIGWVGSYIFRVANKVSMSSFTSLLQVLQWTTSFCMYQKTGTRSVSLTAALSVCVEAGPAAWHL